MIVFSRILLLGALFLIFTCASAAAQQRGSITGTILDADGLVLPGATVTVTEQNTGFQRTVVTAETGAYLVPNLDPGVYTVLIEFSGFTPVRRTNLTLTSGAGITFDVTMQVAGVQEEVVVTAEAPLVDRRSNQIGGTLSGQEIDELPVNFRHVGALTQLVPGMTPNPAQSTFEGGQIVANGTPAQSNLYLVDGMYNNDDRLGGSQGTQVRVVLDSIQEYQVLGNQYSAEYGGGAGAIINMVTRGGTNEFHGRAYSYFRDDRFNARGHFLPDDLPKPEERTLQAGFALGGPIVRDRAHFYFLIERDNEDIAGLKRFPAEAAPLARDFVGTFSVRATNYFGRGDLQLNDANFLSARWILETAPTRGEGFNTNEELLDAQSWESDWDQIHNVTFTSVLSDRATNVLRVGRIGEQLGTGAQTFFAEDEVRHVGFDGRDPFTIGQANAHPSYTAGFGGTGLDTRVRTYTFDNSFGYFVPQLMGGEHTFKAGGGYSRNQVVPRAGFDSGTFVFDTDRPYDPADRSTYPTEFEIAVGAPGIESFPATTKDERYYFFVEDRWRVSNNVTFNVGVRYDNQGIVPESNDDFAPRAGFAWDVTGTGTTVVRGGVGRFNAYLPVSVDLNIQQNDVITRFPTIFITDPNNPVLQPDMITDSQGNPGVAVLSAAGVAELERRRESVLAGTTFNTGLPRVDGPRQLPYQWGWSLGLAQQIANNMAITLDYVANVARDQHGIVDINEPVNGVRPGAGGFDPTGTIIPSEARNAPFRRVLQSQTREEFDSDYQSFQTSIVKRFSNRWGARVAYTVQKSNWVGLGNPDTRRFWLDNDLRADYGRFAFDRRHVLAMSGNFNVLPNFTVAGVVSAISGAPINETTGLDNNRDGDRTDRPIRGVDDATRPIVSEVDSQGRAVINGIDGPGSFGLDMSFRYALPVAAGPTSLDFFYDIFNLTNRENLVPPTGARSSASFLVPRAARFARQMQFGVRYRF